MTGVLDSLEREEAHDLIKSFGGYDGGCHVLLQLPRHHHARQLTFMSSTIAKSVVKKLTHAVVGTDFGEKKMQNLVEVY